MNEPSGLATCSSFHCRLSPTITAPLPPNNGPVPPSPPLPPWGTLSERPHDRHRHRARTMNDPQPSGDAHPHRNPWTRLSRRTTYDNPWITVYHDQVLPPDRQPRI